MPAFTYMTQQMAQMDMYISPEEREKIIQRYDGYNSYKLFHGKPVRIIALEAQYYRRTHNGCNYTYNANLERSNKVINTLNKELTRRKEEDLGMHCISDGAYRMIWSGKHNDLFVPKVTKWKIVNGEKRASRTEIVPNDEAIDEMFREEKIDDLNNCKTTMVMRNKYTRINRLAPLFESVHVSERVPTCTVNAPVDKTLSKKGPNTIVRKVAQPSS
jgi:hypothetical protein